MTFLIGFTLFALILISNSSHDPTGEDIWSELCSDSTDNNCNLFHGIKIWRHKSKISSDPELTRSMTLTELKACCDDRFHAFKILRYKSKIWSDPELTRNMTLTELKACCDDRFVCLENTYCYKDSYNYQILDECIEDVFQKGPMSLCVKKLKDVDPTKLSKCVNDLLEKSDSSTTDCKVIYENGKCYLPDVEKYCDPKFAPVFKQYISLRLYNLACDGRLRYRVGGNGQQNVLSLNSTEFCSENITSGRG